MCNFGSRHYMGIGHDGEILRNCREADRHTGCSGRVAASVGSQIVVLGLSLLPGCLLVFIYRNAKTLII